MSESGSRRSAAGKRKHKFHPTRRHRKRLGCGDEVSRSGGCNTSDDFPGTSGLAPSAIVCRSSLRCSQVAADYADCDEFGKAKFKVSGEDTPPACSSRQLAEMLRANPEQLSCACFRQAAGNYRLAACLPRNYGITHAPCRRLCVCRS